MRFLVTLSALLVLAPLAGAQNLRIVDPVLSVDGRRVATVGAPLVQRPFRVLTVRVPGEGVFTVAARPFPGARLGGQFERDGLVLAAGGQSLRLRSQGAILGDGARRPAYVRFQPSPRGGGPARLSIADGADGRGDRNSDPMPVVAERVLGRGPAPNAPRRVSTETARLRAETARLRGDLDRLIAQRQTLAEQRARLAAERDAALRAQDRAEQRARAERATAAGRDQAGLAARERALSREVQNAADLARRLTAQRDQIAAERDRLLTERNDLIAARATAERERAATAERFLRLQQRVEAADARGAAAASPAQLRQAQAEAERLRAEAGALRAQLVERDATIASLRDQRDVRTDGIDEAAGSLRDVQTQLTTARAARDAAVAQRDRALADLATARSERDDAVRAGDAAVAQRDALRVRLSTAAAERADALRELDALRAQAAAGTGPGDAPDLASEVAALRAQLDRERAAREAAVEALEQERSVLRAERAAIASIPRRTDVEVDAELAARAAAADAREAALDERARILDEQATLATDRSELAAELADARAELARLRAQLDAADTPAPPRSPETDDESTASLPGFDFSRLENPDVIRRRLDEIQYPRWARAGRIEGDVLVLFQTDASGAVIRTAVPTPLGGGLDLLAEDLVRQMRFEAPTVDGEATGLRSQVTVRFQR